MGTMLESRGERVVALEGPRKGEAPIVERLDLHARALAEMGEALRWALDRVASLERMVLGAETPRPVFPGPGPGRGAETARPAPGRI